MGIKAASDNFYSIEVRQYLKNDVTSISTVKPFGLNHPVLHLCCYICYLASPLDFVTEIFATLLTFPFKITCKGKGIVIPKTECYGEKINFWL